MFAFAFSLPRAYIVLQGSTVFFQGPMELY